MWVTKFPNVTAKGAKTTLTYEYVFFLSWRASTNALSLDENGFASVLVDKFTATLV